MEGVEVCAGSVVRRTQQGCAWLLADRLRNEGHGFFVGHLKDEIRKKKGANEV